MIFFNLATYFGLLFNLTCFILLCSYNIQYVVKQNNQKEFLKFSDNIISMQKYIHILFPRFKGHMQFL